MKLPKSIHVVFQQHTGDKSFGIKTCTNEETCNKYVKFLDEINIILSKSNVELFNYQYMKIEVPNV